MSAESIMIFHETRHEINDHDDRDGRIEPEGRRIIAVV